MHQPPVSPRPGPGVLARTGRAGRAALVLLTCATFAAGAAAAVRGARGDAEHIAATAVGVLQAAPQPAVPSQVTDVPPRMDHQQQPATARRPFEHERHEAVSCTACHGAGERHRTLLVRTPQDCAGCHHDRRRAVLCTSCHAAGTLPERGTVVRELSLGVWPTPRTRALPFGHALHEAVACRDCHRAPVTLAMERTCESCHESHHRAEAECAACHSPPQQPVHGPEVHLSCAGSGCHAPAVAPPPTLSRSLCTACHTQQRTHEPDGVCASCHLLRSGS